MGRASVNLIEPCRRPALRCRGWIVLARSIFSTKAMSEPTHVGCHGNFIVSGNADLGALASRRRVPVFGSRLAAGTAALPGGSWGGRA